MRSPRPTPPHPCPLVGPRPGGVAAGEILIGGVDAALAAGGSLIPTPLAPNLYRKDFYTGARRYVFWQFTPLNIRFVSARGARARARGRRTAGPAALTFACARVRTHAALVALPQAAAAAGWPRRPHPPRSPSPRPLPAPRTAIPSSVVMPDGSVTVLCNEADVKASTACTVIADTGCARVGAPHSRGLLQ